MATKVESGEFSLIIANVDSENLASAASKFSKAFSVDEQISAQIVKSAPIIFASDLTKKEVKAITPTLKDLSKEGMEFRVTARVAKKIPKVNWPVRPQFTAGGIEGTNGLAFNWDNNAFVCPSCGETFLFRRLGRLPLEESEAGDPGAAAPAPAPVSASAPTPVPSKEAVRKLEPEVQLEESGPDLEPEVAEEAQEVELPDEVEEIQLGEGDLTLPEEDQPLNLDDGLELAPSEDPVSEPVAEAETLEEAPAENELSEAVEAEIPLEEAAEPAVGDLYNVFLSKISDKKRQVKAADLIAKVKGCPKQEAKELAGRLVIPLAKNVAKEKAEDILAQFKKLKIFGRMTKAK